MSNPQSKIVVAAKHFHRLLAVMAGTVAAALLIPFMCHLVAQQIPESDFIGRFILGGDASPKAALVHILYGLTFLQGFGLSLIAGLALNAPLAYSTYQSARDEFPTR